MSQNSKGNQRNVLSHYKKTNFVGKKKRKGYERSPEKANNKTNKLGKFDANAMQCIMLNQNSESERRKRKETVGER